MKKKISIMDVVGEYVPLNKYKMNEKLGMRATCPCPFCKSTLNNTMILSEKKDMFKCFTCGETGDSIDYLVKAKGFTRESAIDKLNKESGYKSNFESKMNKTKEALYKANSIACRYYYKSLKEEQEACNYLKNRGITKETIIKFSIGYSKYGVNEALKKAGIDKEAAIKSGILRENDGKLKERIFNRIMFPIMINDENGDTRIAGFGGRLLKYPDPKFEKAPKYLNTIATDAFEKKSTLFAMNYAKDSSKKGFILCEGYMDVISLHQAGFDNAIASLGTAFNRFHALKIKSYRDDVYLCFDSDEAGTRAKLKAIPVLRNEGLSVKILNCSPFKDPDELIKEKGKDAFQEVLDNAMDSYEYEIKTLKEISEDFDYEFSHLIYNKSQEEYDKYLDVYDKIYKNETQSNEITKVEFNSSNVKTENDEKENMKIKEKNIYQQVMDEFELDFDEL